MTEIATSISLLIDVQHFSGDKTLKVTHIGCYAVRMLFADHNYLPQSWDICLVTPVHPSVHPFVCLHFWKLCCASFQWYRAMLCTIDLRCAPPTYRLVVHNIAMYRCSCAQSWFHKPTQTDRCYQTYY